MTSLGKPLMNPLPREKSGIRRGKLNKGTMRVHVPCLVERVMKVHRKSGEGITCCGGKYICIKNSVLHVAKSSPARKECRPASVIDNSRKYRIPVENEGESVYNPSLQIERLLQHTCPSRRACMLGTLQERHVVPDQTWLLVWLIRLLVPTACNPVYAMEGDLISGIGLVFPFLALKLNASNSSRRFMTPLWV